MLEHVGIEFTVLGEDFLEARMPVDHRTKQPAGLLHGGASVTLAETLGSIASALCLDSERQMPVGIEVNANHLKSVTTGFVIGRASLVRRGRSLHVWEIKITNEAGDLICVSRLTVMIIEKR